MPGPHFPGTYHVLKKALSTLLAGVLVIGTMTISAFGADYVQNSSANVEYRPEVEVNYDGANQCDVNATVNTRFFVIIPKNVTLDSNGAAGYTVTVDGDLAGTEFVTVAPAAKEGGYFLSEAGDKADIPYTVTQPKTVFIADGSDQNFTANNGTNLEELKAEVAGYEIQNVEAAIVDGAIDAPTITAGTWTGAFNFNIALATKEAPAPAGE